MNKYTKQDSQQLSNATGKLEIFMSSKLGSHVITLQKYYYIYELLSNILTENVVNTFSFA